MATGSKDGEGGDTHQGGALDDFHSGGQGGGVGNLGPGAGGGLPGAGGAMTGNDPNNPGNSPPGGGGGPFGGVSGGGGNAAPGGSSSECSGGVCTAGSPSDFLFGKFQVTVILYYDPATQGGNCNDLLPPTIKQQVCEVVDNSAIPGAGSFLASLWMGTAHALPRSGGGGDGEGEVVCNEVTVQPPIDPSKIPHVVLRSDRSLPTGPSSSPVLINDKPLNPQCSPSGKWSLITDTITVNVSPYPDGNNTWVINIDALYPQEGVWVNRGTRTLAMHCGWDTAANDGSIKCEEQAPSPLGTIQAAPVQGTLLTQ